MTDNNEKLNRALEHYGGSSERNIRAELDEYNSSVGARLVWSFLLPIVGMITGAILLASSKRDERNCASACFISAIIGGIIEYALLSSMLWWYLSTNYYLNIPRKIDYERVNYMKRKIISIACICLTICCSCGNTESSSEPSVDPVSEKISNDIDSIGEVTIEDKELIETIEKTYSTLTESQKNGVTNYADLLNARDELNRIIKEDENKKEAEKKKKEEQEKQKQKEAEEAKQKRYTPDVKLCVQAFVTLEEALKNPDTLKINEFSFDRLDGKLVVYIDASAENGFGGSSRSVFLVTDDTNIGYLGQLSTKTFLYVIEDTTTTSELVSIYAYANDIDHEAVYELYEEYKKNRDFSILE